MPRVSSSERNPLLGYQAASRPGFKRLLPVNCLAFFGRSLTYNSRVG